VSVPPKKAALGGKALLFARNFFRHPRMLGSLVPSSPFLIKRVLRRIDWGTARVIVEYGAGVGTFTSEILRRMRPDAILVAFETNDEFVHYLSETLRDPRLHIVHGSAGQVGKVLERLGRGPADYVISGIPFSTRSAAPAWRAHRVPVHTSYPAIARARVRPRVAGLRAAEYSAGAAVLLHDGGGGPGRLIARHFIAANAYNRST
jgi:hypothetical protein